MLTSPVVTAAERAIADVLAKGEALGQAEARIMELEDERSAIKPACILDMIGKPDMLKGNGGVHSASSAEKVVELHPQYAAHRQKQREAEVAKWHARGAYEAARLTARLHVETIGIVEVSGQPTMVTNGVPFSVVAAAESGSSRAPSEREIVEATR